MAGLRPALFKMCCFVASTYTPKLMWDVTIWGLVHLFNNFMEHIGLFFLFDDLTYCQTYHKFLGSFEFVRVRKHMGYN